MAITDFVKDRSLKGGVLKIIWNKSGVFNYRKEDGYWVNDLGQKVGSMTEKFLDEQLKLVY